MTSTKERKPKNTPRAAPLPGGARGSILVVDDEPGVMLTIQAILAQEGYAVDSAASGAQALERLRARQYDLVLTDLRLGDLDGLDVLAEVRKTSSRTVAIVLTGYASLESAIQAMREGAYDYLVKPTDVEELKLRVAHIFERLQLADELAQRVQELEAANATIDHMNANLRNEIDDATAQLREHVAELNATKIALEAEQTKRERFIAMVAHDLRGPLGPIKFGTQLIARQPDLPANAHAHTQTILEQVDRMERLITDLLDVTRIDVGQFSIVRAPCDLAVMTRKLVEQHQQAHADRTYVAEIPSQPVLGEYDEGRLLQALGNLLDNAHRYSFVNTSITTTLAFVADGVSLSVADEGVGIPPEKVGEIFEPFRRLEHPENISGFGLGLYITKGIAEAHGGQLTVASAADRKHGAAFTLWLPLAK